MAIDRGLLGKALNIINNVGQYGPLDATIDSYKQAADYADDARQYAEIAQSTSEDVTSQLQGAQANLASAQEIYDMVDDLLVNNQVSQFAVNQMKDFGYWSAKLHAGLRVNIACYGDSTTDGNNSTPFVANPTVTVTGKAWTKEPVGQSDHNLEAPSAWPAQLQTILRDYFRTTNAFVYNCGYSGQQMANGWADYCYDAAITNNPFVAKPDVVIIAFGLNDTTAAGNVIEKHISETIKVMTRVLRAGGTPVLMSCDANWRTAANWSAPLAGRDAKEVAGQIDTAKKYLAKSLNIPFIDMDKDLKDWISQNSDQSVWNIVQPDALHYINEGHMMKAGIVAKEFLMDILKTDGKRIERIDWKDTRSKFKGDYSSYYFPSDFRTSGSRFPKSWFLSAANAGLKQVVMDIWVWSEGPQESLIYRGVSNAGADNSVADADLPMINISWLSQQTPYYSKPVPNSGSKTAASHTYDRPYFLTKLKYGLNRIQLISGNDSTKSFYGGWFEFNPFWKSKATFNWFDNYGAPAYIQTNCLKDIGPIRYSAPVLPDPVQYRFAHAFPESIDGSNVADFGNVGDVVDIAIDGYFPDNTGFLLFNGRSYNSAAYAAGAPDPQYDKSLMIYFNTTTTCSLMFLNYPNQTSSPFPTIKAGITGVLTSDFNRKIFIRCTRVSSNVFTVQAWLGEDDISGTLLIDYQGDWASGNIPNAGSIGGFYVNSNFLRPVKINSLVVRKYK